MKRLLALLLLCGLLTACKVMEIQREPVLPTQMTVQETTISTEEATLPKTVPTEVTTAPTEATTLPTETVQPSTAVLEPEDDELVRVKDYIPTIAVELKYATEDNFTGQVIYTFTDAYLRYGTVQKLERVQNALMEQGYSLKIWDGFRPVAAQFDLWEAYPVSTYVANPNYGYSSHSRGNTVDVTMIDYATGEELEMPTGFDDFSTLADRNYSDCTQEAADNARLLENTMRENGFDPYWSEWWHFSDVISYPAETEFIPS